MLKQVGQLFEQICFVENHCSRAGLSIKNYKHSNLNKEMNQFWNKENNNSKTYIKRTCMVIKYRIYIYIYIKRANIQIYWTYIVRLT